MFSMQAVLEWAFHMNVLWSVLFRFALYVIKQRFSLDIWGVRSFLKLYIVKPQVRPWEVKVPRTLWHSLVDILIIAKCAFKLVNRKQAWKKHIRGAIFSLSKPYPADMTPSSNILHIFCNLLSTQLCGCFCFLFHLLLLCDPYFICSLLAESKKGQWGGLSVSHPTVLQHVCSCERRLSLFALTSLWWLYQAYKKFTLK